MRRADPTSVPQAPAAVEMTASQGSAPPSDATERLRRLELIAELFEICNTSGNLNDLMDRVFKKVVADVGAEAGSLWLIDDARTELTCYVAEGPTRDKIVNMRLPKGTGVVGYVIDNAEPQTVYDAGKDPRFSTAVDQKTGFKTVSMICAPLIVERTAIGAIQLINKKGADSRFNPDDLNLLHILCRSSATPIVNARLRASEQKAQELSILLDISREVTATLDLDGCLLSVVNLCSKLVAYDRAVIGLVGPRGVRISAVSGQPSVNQDDPDVLNLRTLLDAVHKKGQDLHIPSARAYLKAEARDPVVEEYLRRSRMSSLAVYRLYDEESELGLFMMESRKENLICAGLAERIAILRNMMTVALRNAQLYSAVPSFSILGRFTSGAGKFPRRLWAAIAAGVVVLLLVAALVRMPFPVAGGFEVQPRQKHVLFCTLEQGVVDRVGADPSVSVRTGDTLLVFNTDETVRAVEKARTRIAMLRQSIGTLSQQANYAELHTKSLELKLAELELAAEERTLRESAVLSPVDGRLASADIVNYAGRKFNRGDQLVEIVEEGRQVVNLYVPERQVPLVRKGQPCRFRVPAYPGVTYGGTVRMVALNTKTENNQTTFPVIVDVTEPAQGLLAGMSGKGKIETAKRSLLAGLLDQPLALVAGKLWF